MERSHLPPGAHQANLNQPLRSTPLNWGLYSAALARLHKQPLPGDRAKGDLHWAPRITISRKSHLGEWLRDEIMHKSVLPKKYLEQAVAIATNALRADLYSETGRLSYSRRPAFYAACQPYPKPFVTFAAMKHCIGALEMAKLIDSEKSLPWPNGKGRQSVITVTPKLAIEAFKRDWSESLELIADPKRALVVVRDRNTKTMLPWPDQDTGHFLSQIMGEINAYLAPVHIGVPAHHVAGQNNDGSLLAVINPHHPDRAPILLAPNIRKRLYLPYLDSFELGGRPVGWDAQSLPSAVRAECTIYGEPVCEVDISACHIALAYASVGKDPPQADPYEMICELTGANRQTTKRAALIMLNARNIHEGIGAITNEILAASNLDADPEAHRAATSEASEIVRAFRKAHPCIVDLVCSDFGVKAQNMEATMMVDTLLTAKAAAFPLIPMHDGVCGPKRRSEQMRDILYASWIAQTGKSPPKITIPGEERTGKRKNDTPHVWNGFPEHYENKERDKN